MVTQVAANGETTNQPLSYDEVKADSWIIVDYEREYFIGLVCKLHNPSRTVRVRCLNLPFGINIPQDLEKESIAADFPEDTLYIAPVRPRGVKIGGRIYKYEY